MTLTANGPRLAVSAGGRHSRAMRAPYVHEATLVMSSEADVDAPGAAVTLALCGSWDHQPPCPLPHHSHGQRTGTTVTLRVVFATEPENEEDVRRRIDQALRTGRVTGPAGSSTQWEFRGSATADLSASEAPRARRLAES
jgi:hypothetical protein